MKTPIGLILCAALSSQAAIVRFDLSPSRTDAAVGLSPLNQVPAVTNSTGSGGVISGGILFDTDTYMLQMAVGYGSAAGFTDLTSAPLAMHIHGPAGAGTNAPFIANVFNLNFSANNPDKGGVIFGNFPFPTNYVDALLSGQTYLNINTTENSTGEIRGQLIPVVANSPPTIGCPSASSVECGTSSELNVLVSDPDGDAMNVIWLVNGVDVQTNYIAASTNSAVVNVSYSAVFAAGTNSIRVFVLDTAGNATTCGTTVVVTDTNAPVITKATASPCTLWPPNNQMVDVCIRALVQDCSSTTWKITGVSANEGTSADWKICGDHNVKLRATRSAKGSGRIYTVTLQATDSSGNRSAVAAVKVTVPHDTSHSNGHADEDGEKDKGKEPGKAKGR
jgi:hypothetical protein